MLDNPAFVRAYKKIRSSLYRDWTQTSLQDTGARETIFFLDRATDTLLGALKHEVESGKMANQQVNDGS